MWPSPADSIIDCDGRTLFNDNCKSAGKDIRRAASIFQMMFATTGFSRLTMVPFSILTVPSLIAITLRAEPAETSKASLPYLVSTASGCIT